MCHSLVCIRFVPPRCVYCTPKTWKASARDGPFLFPFRQKWLLSIYGTLLYVSYSYVHTVPINLGWKLTGEDDGPATEFPVADFGQHHNEGCCCRHWKRQQRETLGLTRHSLPPTVTTKRHWLWRSTLHTLTEKVSNITLPQGQSIHPSNDRKLFSLEKQAHQPTNHSNNNNCAPSWHPLEWKWPFAYRMTKLRHRMWWKFYRLMLPSTRIRILTVLGKIEATTKNHPRYVRFITSFRVRIEYKEISIGRQVNRHPAYVCIDSVHPSKIYEKNKWRTNVRIFATVPL